MKQLITLALVLALCACSNTIGNGKLGSGESQINTQMAGVKTKSDVRKTFGTPNLTFQKENMEVYEYKKIDGAGRYHWMIPVVGWVMSLWQDDYTYKETNLFVTFKGDDIFDYQVIQTGGTTD